jgi:hypothetical protein
MKVAPAKSRKSSDADEVVEEVTEIASAAAAAEPSAGPDYTATPENTEMVRFALTQDIEPAPRIGRFDMLHFTGQPILKKGVINIPKDVAVVLKDKGYGDIL